jgi:hypothetical protein
VKDLEGSNKIICGQILFHEDLDQATYIHEASFDIPPTFMDKVVKQGNSRKQGFVANGESFTYATAPLEFTQRVSTTASAAHSLGLALALKGGIPESGVSLDKRLEHLRGEFNKVEGMERIPIVVGFATRDGSEDKESSQQFGWVFGPSAVPDVKRGDLQLSHSIRAFEVSSDLSLPSWWP